jgi:hypothetical protein
VSACCISRLDRLHQRHVTHKVTMKEPVARTLRHPRERQRPVGSDHLRHQPPLPVDGQNRVKHTITARGEREVEPMQMHRMLRGARVDHAPTHRVANGVAQPLRARPTRTVHHHLERGVVFEARIIIVGPAADEQNALTARRDTPLRIHDQRAHQRPFAFLSARPVIRNRCGRMLHHRPDARPIVVRASRRHAKRDRGAFARREHDGVRATRRRMVVQAKHSESYAEGVVQPHAHQRARPRAQQRPRHPGRLSILHEREGRKLGALRAFRSPAHFADTQRCGECIRHPSTDSATEVFQLRQWWRRVTNRSRRGSAWSVRDGKGSDDQDQ